MKLVHLARRQEHPAALRRLAAAPATLNSPSPPGGGISGTSRDPSPSRIPL
ncbi:hypothetical protein ACFY6U_51410 [Streptomyces sp. NPDC013157]|uniref:hypothetical protein n=1 Tax=Streptomyces sp. NPDC013157 TaxID=3364861 RepID=UPI0036A0F1D3